MQGNRGPFPQLQASGGLTLKPTSLLSAVCLVLFVSSVSAQSLEDNEANQRFTVKGSCALAKDRSAVQNAVVTLFQVRGINNRISELSKQLSDAHGKFLFEGCEKPTLSHLSSLGYAITVQVDGYATQSFEIQASVTT